MKKKYYAPLFEEEMTVTLAEEVSKLSLGESDIGNIGEGDGDDFEHLFG